jgi:hypothetical protein
MEDYATRYNAALDFHTQSVKQAERRTYESLKAQGWSMPNIIPALGADYRNEVAPKRADMMLSYGAGPRSLSGLSASELVEAYARWAYTAAGKTLEATIQTRIDEEGCGAFFAPVTSDIDGDLRVTISDMRDVYI